MWIKLTASANYSVGFVEEAESFGSADNGIGSPFVSDELGGYSTGHDGFKLSVGPGDIAEKTIALDADGTVVGPWQQITASCSAAIEFPGELSYKVNSMEFTNVLAQIIDQDLTFGSSSGSPFPITGFQLDANDVRRAYPVLMQRATNQQVTLRQTLKTLLWTPTKPVSYTVIGSDFQTFFPQQGFTANEQPVTGNFTSNQVLENKIYSRPYDVLWQATPDQPFAGKSGSAGTNTMFVPWAAPIGETPTLKRIRWVVNSAEGATEEVAAADGIHQAIPIAKGGHSNIVPEGQEWKLMDSDNSYQGECDEFAMLMKRMMNVLGIAASTSKVYASTDAQVESPEWQFINGERHWLVMDFDEQNWNAFEGVCLTAGKCYAVWPKYKADSVQHMFEVLPFTQFWCRTNEDVVPGHKNAAGVYWLPLRSYLTPAVPKPDIYP